MKEPLLMDAVRWIGLGLALANDAFAAKLCDRCGPDAFPLDSVAHRVYRAVEMHLAEVAEKDSAQISKAAAMAELGILLRPGVKVSDAILTALEGEAMEASDIRLSRAESPAFTKARGLVRTIHEATAKLLEMARADDRHQRSEEAWRERKREENEEVVRLWKELDTAVKPAKVS